MSLRNRSSLCPWLCNECKDHNDHPSSGEDWSEIMHCSTNDYGKHHSFNDKPSLVFKNKTKIWHKNGVMHRDSGDFVMECHCVHCTLSYVWAENGKIHRINGPAVVQNAPPWTKIYYLKGVAFNSEKEYEKKLNCSLCKRIENSGRTIYCTVNDKGNHHSFDDNPSQIMSIDTYMTRTVSSYWHRDEKIHRLSGPAYTFEINGKMQTEEYWIDNKKLSKEKYLTELQNYQRKITMNQLEKTISLKLRNTNDTLQSAVEAIVSVFCTIGAPFSSGEVARYIRLEKPIIVFAIPQVGRILRDLYINFDMEYSVGGVMFHASRVDRYTDTGHLVFVYGPTQFTAESHDFKVIVPPAPKKTFQSALQQVGQTMQSVAGALSLPMPLTIQANQSQRRVVPRMPKALQKSQNYTLLNEKAKVHTQSRLAVPSTALEKLSQRSIHSIAVPGAAVSFVVDNNILRIVLGCRAGWNQKTIQENKGSCGRLYFSPASLGVSGLTYRDCKNIEFDEQEKELRITL